MTRLRFRIIDINAFPPSAGFADLRARSSTELSMLVNDPVQCSFFGGTACTVIVRGTTLEQPPSQPLGGAFNSSLSEGMITLATPLTNGAWINVRFLLAVQQTGSFGFYVNVEALP